MKATGLAAAFCMIAVPTALGWQTQPAVYQSESVRFQAEVVATGLRQPTALVFLPDGRALLTQRQHDSVFLIDLTSGALTPLENSPAAPVGGDTGASDARRPEGLTSEDAYGLHDLVLHPDYANNGWIYLSYSSGPLERSTTVVDRFRLRGASIVDRERIFEADAWSEDRFHFGGRMVFLDGYLFLTIGDRHHDNLAQELTNHAGKLLRLHDDGRVPADNPFVGQEKAKPEIWSYGHRNAQGLVVHLQRRELWLNEHGPLGGDELNIVRRGANYGWPIISWGWQYSGGPMGQGITRREGMEQPLWIWTPAIAPSGLVIYTGDKFPQWRGSIFSGAMAGRHLNRLVVRDGHVVLEERLMNRQIGRVRMVAQSPDGLLYIGCDDGQLLRLRPAPATP